MMLTRRLVTFTGCWLLTAPFANATNADDAYIAGYAAAELKYKLQLEPPALPVKDGVITFAENLGNGALAK
ncbi:hypothetical protein [Methylomonas sp. CM2]|uniref:hypothetical protein n=1 Tax=Methylomonas sp. CM2 TaxID=3417647 RepID=UPI003CEF815C